MIQKLRSRWALTTVGRSSRVLSRTDQRKVFAVAILQIGLGALDLMGVAAVGVLGALAVSGVQSREPGNRVNTVLEILHTVSIFSNSGCNNRTCRRSITDRAHSFISFLYS